MTNETIAFGEEHDTLGKRLKHARETRRFSRKQLAANSGVGEKTIERYEYETTDAKTSQIDALAEALEVSGAVLQYGPAPDVSGAPHPVKSTEIGEAFVMRKIVEPTRIDTVQKLIEEIQELRLDGFANSPRLSIALIEDLRNAFRYLEIEEIIEIALQEAIEGADDLITQVEQESPVEADDPHQNDPIALVVEQIIDVAIIGADLSGFTIEELEQIANRCELDAPFFGWSNIDQITSALRPILRKKALEKGNWQRLEVLG